MGPLLGASILSLSVLPEMHHVYSLDGLSVHAVGVVSPAMSHSRVWLTGSNNSLSGFSRMGRWFPVDRAILNKLGALFIGG